MCNKNEYGRIVTLISYHTTDTHTHTHTHTHKQQKKHEKLVAYGAAKQESVCCDSPKIMKMCVVTTQGPLRILHQRNAHDTRVVLHTKEEYMMTPTQKNLNL